VNLRRGRPGLLPPPVEEFESRLSPLERSGLEQALACAVVGSPETVRNGLKAFIDRTHADELIVTAQIYDHAARLRSYEITAQVRDELAGTAGKRLAGGAMATTSSVNRRIVLAERPGGAPTPANFRLE